MAQPTVSVITPTYNRPQFLLSAIQTVQEQTYPCIEHVIVDDCSSPPISNFLSTENSDITVHRHSTNKGANTARNTGIDIANGEYIAFLDDDDEWEPTKIEKQVNKAKETGAKAIYTGIKQKSDGNIFATHTPDLSGQITEDLLSGATLNSTSVMMFHSSVFDEVGRFDEELPISQDWEFCVRISTIVNFEPVVEPLVTRHHHNSQISNNYIEKRDVAVPKIWSRYQDLAAECGIKRQFRSTQQFSLGATAVRSNYWREARYHFFRSVTLYPSKTNITRLLAISFGRWSYTLAQKISRIIN
jgi:glycosyltransferase involved in cell wall biosynthesis